MGMAASQARYLALVARKSNCEYEGQQINQSRLALSNQSADLFNQMMGLEVPKTPSKSDYTYTTYTFTDGDNEYKIDKWSHLSESDNDGYNYAVTLHYNKTENIGFQKYKTDPQVLFSQGAPSKTTDPAIEIAKIEMALQGIDDLYQAAKAAETVKNETIAKARNPITYKDRVTINQATAQKDSDTQYTVTNAGDPPTQYIFTQFSQLPEEQRNSISAKIDKMVNDFGIFTESEVGENYANIFYNQDTNSIVLQKDLIALTSASTALPLYHVSNKDKTPEGISTMAEMIQAVDDAVAAYDAARIAYDNASEEIYDRFNVPIKLGNMKLTAISKADLMDENLVATINKIIEQMKELGIENNITKSFNTLTGVYNADTYIGGLYMYDQAASTFYTSYYDLYDSAVNGTGVNNIDDQKRLPYYGTEDAQVEVSNTSRALIQKDKSGRFVSIRLEDDSVVYDLKAVTETDEIAYEDAMNESNYQKALYDKKVQEINAKTSIIQRQDQQLELRLKQLDTEQNALATEIDAVAKVVKDNVEKSFKTFGG